MGAKDSSNIDGIFSTPVKSLCLNESFVYLSIPYKASKKNGRWKRRQGQKNLRPALRPVPHRREWRQTQDRPQLVGILGQKDRSGARFRLLRSQHQEGRELE